MNRRVPIIALIGVFIGFDKFADFRLTPNGHAAEIKLTFDADNAAIPKFATIVKKTPGGLAISSCIIAHCAKTGVRHDVGAIMTTASNAEITRFDGVDYKTRHYTFNFCRLNKGNEHKLIKAVYLALNASNQ